MSDRVCPWWLGYALLNPLRRLFQSPESIVGPFVEPGMVVLEPGPGMGYFTLELARRVGPRGRVHAVDVQQRMLDGLERRLRRAGLADRVQTRLAEPDGLGVGDLRGTVDLALALWVVHEVPDQAAFFGELAAALKPGGRALVVEPRGHVSRADFDRTLAIARAAGLEVLSDTRRGRRLTAVLVRR